MARTNKPVNESTESALDYLLHTDTFAVVGWTGADIEQALCEYNIEPTDYNMAQLAKHINPVALEDAMCEAGWDFIVDILKGLLDEGMHFEEEVQCWDVGFLTTDGTPDVTELCTAVNLTDAEAFAELGRIIDQLRDELKLGEVLSLAKTHTEILPF